jgi:mRNA-degrading endonuclease YafQ of YafQ-DinJ toxin-antitoxin module
MTKISKKPIKNVDLPYLLTYWAEVPNDAARIFDSNVKNSDWLLAVSTAGDYGGSAILAHAMCEWVVGGDSDSFWSKLEKGRQFIGLALDVLGNAASEFSMRAKHQSDLINLRMAPMCLLSIAILLDDSRLPDLAEQLSPFLVRDDTGYEALDALSLVALVLSDNQVVNESMRKKVSQYLLQTSTKDAFKGDFMLALAVADNDLNSVKSLLNVVDDQFLARAKDHKTLGMLKGLSWQNQVEFDLLASCISRIHCNRGGGLLASSRAVPSELWQSL